MTPIQQALTADAIHDVLRSGTAEERIRLLRALPPSTFRDLATQLVTSDRIGMVVVAVGPLATSYCAGAAPAEGEQLALATHRIAVEVVATEADHGLIPTTLSGLASAYTNAAGLLGHSQDVLDFTAAFIPYYEALPEPINLRSLKLHRAAALLNLDRLDEAADLLDDATLPGNPATDIELERLRKRLAQLRDDVTKVASRGASEPNALASEGFLEKAIDALEALDTGPSELIDAMRGTLKHAPRLDPSEPEDFERLLDGLRQGEAVLRGGAQDDNEISIRARVREASGIFVHGTPPAPVIRDAIEELEYARDWAQRNGLLEIQNDALWGIYLCHSRLKEPSRAADALLGLRSNLERARARIVDPRKRGGAFSVYPHLFGALVEKLHASGRKAEVLEAIEGSKGRAVADVLTAKAGEVIEDTAISGAADHLPELCARHGFAYLTYYIDDNRTYAVLVTPSGDVRASPALPLSRAAVREAAAHVDPRQWGAPAEWDPYVRLPDASAALAPLVAWLQPLLDEGALETGGHLCVAADDDLANVPFAYLPLGGTPLVETLSVSRIHNAHHLAHVLAGVPAKPAAYLGVMTAPRQDTARANWDALRGHLAAPIETLSGHLQGDVLEGTGATAADLLRRPLGGRVIHFSTHGIFPTLRTDASPFDASGLVLSDGRELPDIDSIARGDLSTVLTPRRVLDAGAILRGSHVSMMACVSGLSREGIGGDALGLEWALIQVGASSMLASHWYVSAEVAANFLSGFYQRWLGEALPRRVAWRETVAALRASGGPHGSPAAWAAFSLTGDWR